MTSNELTQTIESMLRALKATGRCKGTRYCKVATRMGVEREGDVSGVLSAMAAECGVKPTNATRCLEYLSDRIWERAPEQLQEYAGDWTLYDRPSPLDLIIILTEHIRQKKR